MRRDDLAEAATDYVLGHGLIGLSLRPLAADLGTSDRMLLYHFGSKDDLVAAVLRIANNRSVAAIRRLPASRGVRAAVVNLWRAMLSEPVAACSRLYVESSALGLLGREPYASSVRETNGDWLAALSGHLIASGVDVAAAPRVVGLVDAAFMGFVLDLALDDDTTRDHAVSDLADAAELIAEG